MSSHLVELHVERPIKFSQPLHHLLVYVGMGPPFCLAQAVGFAAPLGLLQARKTLGFVEVEVFVRDDPLEAQKVLDSAKLACRVTNEPLPADKEDLPNGEIQEPVLQVLGVNANLDGAPGSIDKACSPVFEGQALKGGDVRFLGQSLCVVRNGSGHRVPHHHNELGVL